MKIVSTVRELGLGSGASYNRNIIWKVMSLITEGK